MFTQEDDAATKLGEQFALDQAVAGQFAPFGLNLYALEVLSEIRLRRDIVSLSKNGRCTNHDAHQSGSGHRSGAGA